MAKAKSNPQNQDVIKNPLAAEMEKIEKDYGVGTFLKDKLQPNDIISTGSLKLDIKTGIGGCARGTVLELMGWESSGKSTIASCLIANAQKKGLGAVLIDGENSFDPTYATALGVDVNRLTIYQADNGGGEKAYDIAERLIKTGKLGIVVFDSQTVLLPKKMFDDPAEASNIGLHARLLSRVMPKFVALAGMYKVLVVFISQFREKIGVMYGNPETTNGGNALKFYSHMRIEFRKSILSDGDKNPYANKTTAKVVKNKLAPPFGKAEFHMIFGQGVDRVREILDVAIDLDIIQQSGSWYSYGETKLGQGEDGILQMLRDNPTYADRLYKLIIDKLKEQSNGLLNNETTNSTRGDGEELGQPSIEDVSENNTNLTSELQTTTGNTTMVNNTSGITIISEE